MICPDEYPEPFANQYEQDNEEACDHLERVEAECEAYHAAIDAEVDAQIEALKAGVVVFDREPPRVR